MPSSRRPATKSSGEAQSAGLKRFQFFFIVRASGLGFMDFLFWVGGGETGGRIRFRIQCLGYQDLSPHHEPARWCLCRCSGGVQSAQNV